MNSLYLGSNASYTEIAKYGSDKEVREALEELATEQEAQEMEFDRVDDALYTATHTINMISQAVDSIENIEELRREIKALISDE